MGSVKARSRETLADSAGSGVSLGSTLNHFANRMKRKLREQESRDAESQRDAESRHSRMLQALNIMRRALQETGQIQLGDRFELALDVSDYEGWPRLNLNLVDVLLPDKNDFALVVTGHDRKNLGTVELRLKSGQLLGEVHLQNEGELERIPIVLKKAVRTFLDRVSEYVLNPVDPSAFKRIESELLESEEVLDEQAQTLSKQNVFSDDDYSVKDNMVAADSGASLTLDAGFEAVAMASKTVKH